MIEYLDKHCTYLVDDMYKNNFNTSLNYNDPFKKVFYYIFNNKIVAFIDYSLIYDRIELNYIFVLKEYRKKGIASSLLNKMFEEKINNISLEVNVNNLDAINLYKKYNFEVVSIREKYYNGEDAYLMIRK